MSEEESPLMVPLRLWTVEKQKDFLRTYNLPVTGVKAELLRGVGDCYDAMFFEAELDPALSTMKVSTFHCAHRHTWRLCTSRH